MNALTIAELRRRFVGRGLHRFEARWPPRMVVRRAEFGWNHCARCDREYRVWITLQPLWRRLPRPLRREMFCTKCFRTLVGRPEDFRMVFIREERWWVVRAPDLQGAITQGKTKKSARKHLLSLIRMLQRWWREDLLSKVECEPLPRS